MADTGSDDKSRIEPLVVPDFKSTIPGHLLAKMNEQDRWLFENISIMEEREKWLVRAVVEDRKALIEADTKATAVKNWKDKLTSRWGLLVAAFILIAPVIIKALLERWMKNLP